MSQRTSSAASWLASPPPSIAVEVTATRVVAVALNDHGGRYSIASHAIEPLAEGVATPALNAANVHDEAALTAAVRSVLGNLSARSRRVALVLPDSAAKVSLDSLNKFIKEMGLSKPETQPSLKVTRSGLPNETRVVVLDYQRS